MAESLAWWTLWCLGRPQILQVRKPVVGLNAWGLSAPRRAGGWASPSAILRTYDFPFFLATLTSATRRKRYGSQGLAQRHLQSTPLHRSARVASVVFRDRTFLIRNARHPLCWPVDFPRLTASGLANTAQAGPSSAGAFAFPLPDSCGPSTPSTVCPCTTAQIPPCGPAGEKPANRLDRPRQALRFGPRRSGTTPDRFPARRPHPRGAGRCVLEWSARLAVL